MVTDDLAYLDNIRTSQNESKCIAYVREVDRKDTKTSITNTTTT